jgi:type IV secretory pathway VirB6-like protein
LSFSRLITDQAANFANILDARSLEMTFQHLDDLWARFLAPNAWALLPTLLYWLILIVISVAKGAALLSIAYGMIATAVCALLGPIFVPFFIVKQLDFLFWNWFRAFIQFAFIQVVAFAYLMIFERFAFQLLTVMPAGITPEQYLLYGVEVIVLIGTFALGTLFIPSLTSAIFSGGGSYLSTLSPKVISL